MNDMEERKLFSTLDDNINQLKSTFDCVQDIVFREFYAGENRLFIVYVDNLVLGTTVENAILTNLMVRGHTGGNAFYLNLRTIAVGETTEIDTFEKVCNAILLGDTVLFSVGYDKAIQISTKGWPSRGIPTVTNEVTVQGAKDAFVELASKNIVLIRRRIKDTSLKVQRMNIGTKSKTDIVIMYMEGIVREDILKSFLEKINNINTDVVLDSGTIQQFLEADAFSPFPQLQVTERPDKTAASINEGRIAVLVDNSPFALLVPSTINVFFQAADDYYERWEIVSLVRLMRFTAAILATILPALYIGLTIFHPNLIPTSLVLKIAAGRASVPFPTIVEVLIMELAFELLKEAGIRLPSPIGGTIGIVGGIIIGQSAVEAGIVGPAVVIVAALTGVCSFVVPSVTLVSGIRITKYFMIILSSLFGLVGFWLGIILILAHLCSLESFGVPYMFPFCSGSANSYSDFKDSIIRFPIPLMKKRPIFATKAQEDREKDTG